MSTENWPTSAEVTAVIMRELKESESKIMSTPNALPVVGYSAVNQDGYEVIALKENQVLRMFDAGEVTAQPVCLVSDALAAIDAASAVQPGYAIVPIEPTREMIAALFWEGDLGMMIGHYEIAQEGYADYANMLAAAPQPLIAADLLHLWETIYDHGAGKHKGAISLDQRQKAFEILKRMEQPPVKEAN